MRKPERVHRDIRAKAPPRPDEGSRARMPGSIVFNRFVAPLNPSVRLFTKHPRWDSNPKPSAPEADALSN